MMQKIPYQEARKIVLGIQKTTSKHMVPVADAAGRVLAEPLFARFDVPIAPASAMDGFAVNSADTANASESNPVELRNFERVNTGNVVKEGFDAVIMIEDVTFDGSDKPSSITIKAPIKKGRNVRLTGEDIQKGGMILPAGALIRPFDVGALASYGYTEIPVNAVSVGIIPTGSELITAGETPKPGDVVESNSHMMTAYIRSFGVLATCYHPVPDERDTIKAAIEKAIQENDIVLLSAGSSMGSKDFTSRAIQDLGELKFHGVFMKPAKPVMLGIVNGKAVIGLPGFPLAVATGLRMLVRPLLESWGYTGPAQTTITAVAGSDVETEPEIDELRFGAVSRVEGRYVALPMIRSASAQMNGIRANCYLHIPRGFPTVPAGETVQAIADATPEEIAGTILIGGEQTKGMQKIISKAAETGLFVRIGTGNPQKLLEGHYVHGVCTKEEINCPATKIVLDDGSFLYLNTDLKDHLSIALKYFAEK